MPKSEFRRLVESNPPFAPLRTLVNGANSLLDGVEAVTVGDFIDTVRFTHNGITSQVERVALNPDGTGEAIRFIYDSSSPDDWTYASDLHDVASILEQTINDR